MLRALLSDFASDGAQTVLQIPTSQRLSPLVCVSAAEQVLSTLELNAARRPVRIATEYQIEDFDVFSICLETRCPVAQNPE